MPASTPLRTWLTPRFIKQQLAHIDQQAAAERQAKTSNDGHGSAQIWIIIGIACCCLLLVHYGKYSSNLAEGLRAIAPELYRDYIRSPYRELWGYVWWGSINVLGFLIIPMLTIRFWLKHAITDYGWQWGDTQRHWQGYLLLTLPIVVFAIIVSFGNDFSRHYPFYDQASRSIFDLLAWEMIYIAQFIAVEFFFRGFLVNGLRPQFGSASIAIMCLPYLMLHFPKLWPESLGAILFGFFLGLLALMSRSIWGGVCVHVAIALTMDIAALIQTKGLPTQW